MLCEFVLTNEAFVFTSSHQSLLSSCTITHIHTYTHAGKTFLRVTCKSLSGFSVFSLLLVQHSQSGGMLVDQCVSEAIICLADVLLWVGRWGGYPYPPSGHPGMDEMLLWPSAERDQGITVLCYPTSTAILTNMSNNERAHVIRTDIRQAWHFMSKPDMSLYCNLCTRTRRLQC